MMIVMRVTVVLTLSLGPSVMAFQVFGPTKKRRTITFLDARKRDSRRWVFDTWDTMIMKIFDEPSPAAAAAAAADATEEEAAKEAAAKYFLDKSGFQPLPRDESDEIEKQVAGLEKVARVSFEEMNGIDQQNDDNHEIKSVSLEVVEEDEDFVRNKKEEQERKAQKQMEEMVERIESGAGRKRPLTEAEIKEEGDEAETETSNTAYLVDSQRDVQLVDHSDAYDPALTSVVTEEYVESDVSESTSSPLQHQNEIEIDTVSTNGNEIQGGINVDAEIDSDEARNLIHNEEKAVSSEQETFDSTETMEPEKVKDDIVEAQEQRIGFDRNSKSEIPRNIVDPDEEDDLVRRLTEAFEKVKAEELAKLQETEDASETQATDLEGRQQVSQPDVVETALRYAFTSSEPVNDALNDALNEAVNRSPKGDHEIESAPMPNQLSDEVPAQQHEGLQQAILSQDDNHDEREEDIESKEAAAKAEVLRRHEVTNEQYRGMTEIASGIEFASTIGPGLYLTGVGVRKRTIVNVYAVAMYTAPEVKDALMIVSGKDKRQALSILQSEAKAVPTTFLLDYVFKTSADVIATTLGDAVQSRMESCPDVSGAEVHTATELFKETLFEAVDNKGGVAAKGTILMFDCESEGVRISLDGEAVGSVPSSHLSKAICDMYLDDKTFSPQLRDSCIQTWCAP